MYPVSGFLPESWIRELRFGPLFPEIDFHDGHSRLSWDARSTLSSKKNQAFSYWLLAFS